MSLTAAVPGTLRKIENLLENKHMDDTNHHQTSTPDADFCGELRTISGLELIAAERQLQIVKGYTPEHDDGHRDRELAAAAGSYALHAAGFASIPHIEGDNLNFDTITSIWPFGEYEFDGRTEQMDALVKAGALIVAEIDRIHRLRKPDQPAPAPPQVADVSGPDESLTPETDAMIQTDAHRIEEYSAPRTAYIRMCELARTLERERDEWRKKAVDLHARHKGALEDIETEIAARDEARRLAKDACELLDREGYQVNYPPMPWEPDSPEFVEPDSPEIKRLAVAIQAATVLIAAKGRHNTMLAYNGLRAAIAAVKDSE